LNEKTPVEAPSADNPHRDVWYAVFGLGHPDLQRYQRFNLRLPAPPRCKLCYAPYRGVGSLLMRFQGRAPSSKNPQFCSRCDTFLRKFPGGAEVPATVMFADVRGSTRLAAAVPPEEFSRMMQAFYAHTMPLIYAHDGFVIDVQGDGVTAIWPPGFSGPDHARKAITAARALLASPPAISNDANLRFGIGLHSGHAFIGTMTGAKAGIEDIAAWGECMNHAAHLCAACESGEVLVSEACAAEAGLDMTSVETRNVTLKGSVAPEQVVVLK
jgi:adenylate cyclase